MISTVINLVNSQCAPAPVFSGDPWIPTPKRKRHDRHPRGSFPSRFRSPLAHARFPRHFPPPDRQTTLPLSTVLTETPQLDFSYEAATPSRLDLVLRQQGFRIASSKFKLPVGRCLIQKSNPIFSSTGGDGGPDEVDQDDEKHIDEGPGEQVQSVELPTEETDPGRVCRHNRI